MPKDIQRYQEGGAMGLHLGRVARPGASAAAIKVWQCDGAPALG